MVLDILMRGGIIILCGNINLKIKLASILIDHLLIHGHNVLVVDEHSLLTRYLPEHVFYKIKVFEKPALEAIDPSTYVVVFEPHGLIPRALRLEKTIVFTSTLKNLARSLRGLDPVIIKTVSKNMYLLHDVRNGFRTRFSIMGSEIKVIEKPEGAFGKALEIVENAMALYGELTTRDALRLISRELGVSKEMARRILGKLVEDKYIRVLKGKISLA